MTIRDHAPGSIPSDRVTALAYILTIVFGFQLIRAFLAYLQPILGERLSLPPLTIGLLAMMVFGVGFLVALLGGRLGVRRLVMLTASGLGAIRLGIQLWPGDPLADMGMVAIGVMFFVIFLPLPLVVVRSLPTGRDEAARGLAATFLVGLAVDTTLHGLFLTYDYIWQSGFIATLLAIGLFGAQVFLLRRSLTRGDLAVPVATTATNRSLRATLPWLAMGPALFLALMISQNLARLTTLTGWILPLAFAWILLAQLVGVALCLVWRPSGWLGEGLIGLALVLLLLPGGAETPVGVALTLLLGQAALSCLLTSGFIKLVQAEPQPGLKWLAVIHGLSMISLVVLIFAFYVAYTIPVPYQNDWLLPLAGLIVALAVGWGAKISSPWAESRIEGQRRLTVLGVACFIGPLLTFIFWHRPAPIPAEDRPLRLMTYNIHNGFDARGHLNLEELALAIEAQQPDVVSLQEVSRGWLVNGSLDMVSWLAQRLEMPYVFTASSGPLWGHAIFSRYPLRLSEAHPLPPADLPLQRAFAYHQLDLGGGRTLNLINTHFHHGTEDGHIRELQAGAILEFVVSHTLSQVIIAGDLNARPDTPELTMLLDHSFSDVVAANGLLPGYTYRSDNPVSRLDYILISLDLRVGQVVIPASTASDHMSIVATVE